MANTYYIDPRGGNGGDGLSPGSALRSIDQVNDLDLGPGDRVLFRSGQTFEGGLEVSADGVTVGAYGSGAAPVIKGGGKIGIEVTGDGVTVEGLELTGSHKGIVVSGAEGVKIVGVTAHHNDLHGIEIGEASSEVLVEGGSFYDNGRKNGGDGVGHGIIVENESHDVTVDGARMYRNAESGIQFANDALDNNVVRNSEIYANNEDGVAIKGGNHMLVGNSIHDNGKNGVNLYQNSDYLYLFGNDIRSNEGHWANALIVRDGAHVVSANNRYEGGNQGAVNLNLTAGDGSRFTNDLFVDSGQTGNPTVNVDAGTGHVFDGVAIVRQEAEGSGLAVRYGADDVTLRDSQIYTKSGWAVDVEGGKAFTAEGNAYYRADGSANWARHGEAYSKADIAALDPAATTGSLSPSELLKFATSDTVVEPPPEGQTVRPADDKITVGSSGDDTIRSGAGDDGIAGGYGDDTIHGGAGDDYLQGAAGNDTLHGEAGNDELSGNTGHEKLYGGAGNDRLHGEGGDDRIDGGKGADVMSGDSGTDTFVFRKGEANGDSVIDFAAGRDELRLEDYGSDAVLKQVDEGTWQIVDGGSVETVKIVGDMDQGDYLFA